MINIKIDSPDKDMNAAIAVLIHSRLIGLNLSVKIEEPIAENSFNKTVYMSTLVVENKLKTDDVVIVIS